MVNVAYATFLLIVLFSLHSSAATDCLLFLLIDNLLSIVVGLQSGGENLYS